MLAGFPCQRCAMHTSLNATGTVISSSYDYRINRYRMTDAADKIATYM